MTSIVSTKQLTSAKDLILLAQKIVERYTHVIPNLEKEDVVMHMVEQFLQQEEKITKGFNNKSKATTYCYAVLNRMCCGIIRKELPKWQKIDSEDMSYIEGSTSFTDTADALVIQDEINFLEKIFTILNDNSKSILFFGYYYRLLPKEKYIHKYAPKIKSLKVLELITPGHTVSKNEILSNLSKLTKLVEDRKIGADAVRMWLNKQQLDIISKLNGKWGRGNYDKETFHTLFELFYKNK